MRSSSVEPPAAPADDHRPGAPTGPHPGRRDERAERGEQVVDQVEDHRPSLVGVGDRPERREDPGMVEGELAGPGPAQDVGQREGDGRGRGDGPRPTGRDDEVGRRAVRPLGRPFGQPAERRAGGGHPQAHALARRVRPRGDPQLAHPVAQAVPVGAPGRPLPHPIDDRVVGLGRCQARGRDDRQVERRGSRRRRPARPTRGSRRRSRSRRRRSAGRGPRPGRRHRHRAPGGRRPAEARWR